MFLPPSFFAQMFPLMDPAGFRRKKSHPECITPDGLAVSLPGGGLFHHEGLAVHGAHGGQDTVEMVILVLDQLR